MKTQQKVKEEQSPPEVVALDRGGALAVVEGERLFSLENIAALTEKVKAIMLRAHSLTAVETQEAADTAGLLVQDIGPVRKFIKQVCDPVCEKLDRRHKAATGLRRFFDAPMASLEDRFNQMIGRYVLARERERQKQQALSQVEADKKHQRDVRSTAVTATILHGKPLAKEIAAEMGDAPPVVLEKTVVQGVKAELVWYAEVENFKALATAVVAGQVPWAAIIPDVKFIDDQAELLGGEMQWPGVRTYQDVDVKRARKGH